MPPRITSSSNPIENGGRELQKLGHEVRLIAPRFVLAYLKANKNDTADAEGIC